VLEGQLISVAPQTLLLSASVVLDFGFWGRDKRPTVRWLARSAGEACQVAYLPVDGDGQLARISARQASTPASDIHDDRRRGRQVARTVPGA